MIKFISLEHGLIEVKSVNGNNDIGGEDFLERLFNYCFLEFKKKTGIDIKDNRKALNRLKKSCEDAIKQLSIANTTTIDIESLANGENLEIEITRQKFEDLCMDLFQKCIISIENVLKDSHMSKSQIDEIVLIGGSSRIPRIQSILEEYFNGKELNKTLNPDEAVALGAAIQAAVMTNVKNDKIDKLILLDVIPFSIGIEAPGGVMSVFIRKNSSIPCKNSQVCSTYTDNQPSYFVKIFEGENRLTKDNFLLDQFTLEGIPPMPKGQAQIEVIIGIDTNFIIDVSAVEKSSGIEKKIVVNIRNELLLKSEDIIALRQKLEKEDDVKYINQFENYVNHIKEDIYNIMAKIDDILIWIQNNQDSEIEEINKKKDELDTLLGKLNSKNKQNAEN